MRAWNDLKLTPAERERAIARILDAGALPRRSLLAELRTVYAALDLRMLFFGVGECLFLALVAAVLLFIPMAAAVPYENMASLLFLFSPVLYALLTLFTAWKEQSCGVLDWRQTCRVSLRETAALRMLVFGGISVLTLVPANAVLWALSPVQVSFGWMLGVSLSSLFLYGALSLMFQQLRRRAGWLMAPVVWTLAGLILLSVPQAGAALLQVPAVVFFLLAGGWLAVYLLELRRFCLISRKGDMCDALY